MFLAGLGIQTSEREREWERHDDKGQREREREREKGFKNNEEEMDRKVNGK